MTPSVALTQCDSYDHEKVEDSARRIVDLLGGIASFVGRGDSVLIKPNLLAPKTAQDAVNTHASVVRSVLKLVLEAGGRPVIGDSPGIGSARKNAALCGIDRVASEFGVPIVEFTDSIPAPNSRSGRFPLELAREALEADVIINIPKLKTHGQLLMTLGVKNLFGCVVGRRKAQWHLKAGVNRDAFARMLVQIYMTLSPGLTLIDGIVGMEGNGPGNGTPRPLGILAAARDAVALDSVIMKLLSMDPERLPTLRAAAQMGVGETDTAKIRVLGEETKTFRIRDLKLPDSLNLEWNIPDFLVGVLKDTLTPYPASDPKLCQLCNICVEACPQQVIRIQGDHLEIDTRRCIRCFCCQELCPHGAMKTRQSYLLKLLKKWL